VKRERIPEVSSKNETPQLARASPKEDAVFTNVDYEVLFTELEEEMEKIVSKGEKWIPSLPLISSIISPVSV
jgi:hypothetical protein